MSGAVYKYTHGCGETNEIFLRNATADRIQTKCHRCGREAIAHRQRNAAEFVAQRDGEFGIMERDGRR